MSLVIIINYLIHRRRDGSEREQFLKLVDGEVADSNGLGEAKSLAFLHRCPHTLRVEFHYLRHFNWVCNLSRFSSDGPVDQKQVQVFQLKRPAWGV